VADEAAPSEKIATTDALGMKQEQVFASYVRRMLTRRTSGTRYTPQQTIQWLSYLAAQMRRQSQSIFYLEQMQPDWLSGSRMLGVYDWLAVRLPGVLMGMLVIPIIGVFFGNATLLSLIPIILLGGLLGGLLSEGSIPQRPVVSGGKARSALGPRLLQWLLIGALIGLGSDLSYGLSVVGYDTGLSDVLSAGLSYGLSYGIYSILLQFLLGKNSTAEARSQTLPPARGTAWQRLIRRREIHNGLLVGLSYGLSYGLLDVLILGLRFGLINGPLYWLSSGLSVGLINGLSFGLSAWGLSLLLIGRSTAIQPTDLLVWSRRSLGKSLFSRSHVSATLRVAALSGLSSGLSIWLSGGLINGLLDGPILGLILGLSYWLLLGLSRGVAGVTIEDQQRVVPNQGIRRSALNGLLLGLISTVIVGLLGGLRALLNSDLRIALLAGLSAGLLLGLLNGGLASFRHYVLRFLLWRTGAVPWHSVPFLDSAAERILLRKVGGGYIFLHRLLLDYFADLETEPGSVETAESRQEGLQPETMPSISVEPTRADEHTDVLAVPLAPTTLLSDVPRLLPCGHELSTPSARFCRVCGASLARPHTPT